MSILGDGADKATLWAGVGKTLAPPWNLTPAITFGNWFSPISRRQLLAAAITSLNTISRAVVGDSEPLVRTVRCLTATNTLSIGFVTGIKMPVPLSGWNSQGSVVW